MIATLSLFVAFSLTAVIGWNCLRATHRRQLSASEANAESDIAAAADSIAIIPCNCPAASFHPHLAVIPNLLQPRSIETLQKALRLPGVRSPERSFVPFQKKGGTLSHLALIEQAPAMIAFYRSRQLQTLVADFAGEAVVPTPLWDQSSCSLLVYEKPGDHIGWHYDYNFYRGRHFTVLLVIEDSGPNGPSTSRLQVQSGGETCSVPPGDNTLIVFEGRHVLHRVTRLGAGERRQVLSMTFTTDPSSSFLQGVQRRIKDMAYFGLRALWT